MRQGQQHRRGRGRNNGGSGGGNNNNNHRRGQNPLSRSFESNGPDVKVRGTPADIASKYLALARDAQSSGDPVLAENYFQHAEHYNRIIMAYREQQVQQQSHDGSVNGNPPRFRQDGLPGQEQDDGADEDGDDMGLGDQPNIAARTASEQARSGEAGQRPDDGRPYEPRQSDARPEGRPYEGRQQQDGRHDNREGRGYEGRDARHSDNRNDRGQDRDRPRQHGEHQQRFRDRDRQDQRFNRHEGRHENRNDRNDRGDRFDRDRGERFDRDRDRDRGDRFERGERSPDRPSGQQQSDAGFSGDRRPADPRSERGLTERPAAPYERPTAERAPVERVAEERAAERPLEADRPVEPAPVVVASLDEAVATDPPTRAREGGTRRRAAPAAGLGSDQPEFLRRPVRRPRRDPEAASDVPPPPSSDDGQGPQT